MLAEHCDEVWICKWSPSGRYLATGSKDYTVSGLICTTYNSNTKTNTNTNTKTNTNTNIIAALGDNLGALP